MKASTLLFITLMVILTFSLDVNPNYTFEEYVRQFNKNYEEPEYSIRQQIFTEAFIQILESRISGESTYTIGVNRFTDWTEEEKKSFNSMRVQNNTEKPNLRKVRSSGTVRSSLLTPINYKSLGQVSSVKDQGFCGACWAFSSTALYESQLLIHENLETDLSEQYLISCSGAGSCYGGTPIGALNSIRTTGLPNETAYPFYTPFSSSSQCVNNSYNKLENFITDIQHFDELTDYEIQEILINKGPVSVGISAGSADFMAYEGGVYNGCVPGAEIDHSVLLVGFTADGDYIIKNSWGPYWGEDGYMTIKGSNDCGLKSYVDVVTVESFTGVVNETAEYEDLEIFMISNTGDGWHGNVLGVIQEGEVVASFGENFTSGTEQNLTVSIKKNVEAKIVFIAYANAIPYPLTPTILPNGNIVYPPRPMDPFLYAIRYYMWAQGVPVYSSPSNSPYQSGYIFGTFCLGGCPIATTDSVFITLTDSGADGWNGNSLKFSQGSFSEEFGLNFTSGATNGPIEFVVNITSNFSIVPFTLANDRQEIGFIVKDKYNNIIAQRLPGSSYSAADILVANCLGCVNHRPVKINSVQAISTQSEVAATETESVNYVAKGSDSDKEIVAISILAAIILFLTILVGALTVAVLRMVRKSDDTVDIKSDSVGESGESQSQLNKNRETLQQGM